MTTQTDGIEAEINRSRTALNDTIEQLGGKLSPGQIVDEVLGIAKGQFGDFTANLGRQVRDNPMPLLLIGAGIGLMLMKSHGGGQPDAKLSDDDHLHHTQFSKLESARAGLARLAHETEDAFSHRLHQAEAAALDLKQHAGEAIDGFKQRVKAAADSLGQKASAVRDRMKSAGAQSAHYLSEQAQHVKEGAGWTKHAAQDFYAEYPLAVGAIGLAVGALIGASAPLSGFEKDKLGGLADAAGRSGSDLAAKGAQAVKDTVDRVVAPLH